MLLLLIDLGAAATAASALSAMATVTIIPRGIRPRRQIQRLPASNGYISLDYPREKCPKYSAASDLWRIKYTRVAYSFLPIDSTTFSLLTSTNLLACV